MHTTQTPPTPEQPCYRVTSLLDETQFVTRYGSLYVMAVWIPLVPFQAGVPRGATYFYASSKKNHPRTFMGVLTPHAPSLEGVPQGILNDLADREYGKALKDAPASPEAQAELTQLARAAGACSQCAASTLGTTEGDIPAQGYCDHCGNTQVEPQPVSDEQVEMCTFMSESLESLGDDLLRWVDVHRAFPLRVLRLMTPIGQVSIDLSKLEVPAGA